MKPWGRLPGRDALQSPNYNMIAKFFKYRELFKMEFIFPWGAAIGAEPSVS